MADAAALVELYDIAKQYGGTEALANISFEISLGEVLAVIGTNGAGKTTLLHLLAGLLFPSAGTISVAGLDRWKQNFDVRKFTTFVPANAMPVGETKTPVDYLQFIGQIYGMKPAVINQRIRAMSAALQNAAELHKPWHSLSLGHGKKALLMAAFLPDARLRILDEPFAGGIDPPGMETLYAWIEQAKVSGETIVFSTQVLDQAEDFADRLLLLDNGRIRFLGTPAELLDQANVAPDSPRPLAKAFMALARSR